LYLLGRVVYQQWWLHALPLLAQLHLPEEDFYQFAKFAMNNHGRPAKDQTYCQGHKGDEGIHQKY
jgi:hypothetical protein